MRLIDADILSQRWNSSIQRWESEPDNDDWVKDKYKRNLIAGVLRDVVATLKSQPTVEKRPKGKWESYIDYDRFDGHDEDGLAIYRDILVYRCPFCGNKIHNWAKNYCAECGAELEVAE